MTDLSSFGYPQGYHQGLSAILWIICIIGIFIIGVKLLLNSRKIALINGKQMYRAKGILYTLGSFQLYIQIGIFFPNYFQLLFSIATFIYCLTLINYFYKFEKNLTSIKFIPTLLVSICFIIACICLIDSLFFNTIRITLLLDFLTIYDVLIYIFSFLYIIAFLIYIFLILKFAKNTKGNHNKAGGIWVIGVILALISLLDQPPIVGTLPSIVIFYGFPIMYFIGAYLMFYGVNRLFIQISSFYNQTHKCTVHRGFIEGKVHYCPSCKITYCGICFEQVIKQDGCWNCGTSVSKMGEIKSEPQLEEKDIIMEGNSLDLMADHKTPKKK